MLAVASALLAASAESAVRPHHGGSLERAHVGAIRTLDPLEARGGAALEAAMQVHAGLYRSGADGEPVADLVERVEVAADALSVSLWLRPAWFHDGRAVSAEDARASLARFAASTGAGRLLVADPARGLEAVVTGERELRLKIEPAPELWRWILADPRAAVQPLGGAEGGRIGAGPFRVESLSHDGGRLSLQAFERHPRGRPLIDSLVYRGHADWTPLLLAWRRQASDVAELPAPEGEGVRLVARSRELVALRIDATRPPLDQVAVREAIAGALRLDALIGVVLAGRVQRAAGLLLPELDATAPARAAAASPLRPGSRPLALGFRDAALRAVAERLRVDLHAAGIVTELAGPGSGSARGAEHDLELVVLPGGDGVPELELADAFRMAGRELPPSLRLAATGDPHTPRTAERRAAERELLADGTLLPLYRRERPLFARAAVRDLAVGAGGLLAFEDAWRWPPAATRP